MITRVWYKTFKLLDDVSLDLGRINVIVGRNAVGKSTALDGLHLLMQLARPNGKGAKGRIADTFSGANQIEFLASRPAGSGFELGVAAPPNVQFGVRALTSPKAAPDGVEVWFGSPAKAPARAASPLLPRWDPSVAGMAEAAKAGFGEVVRLRLDAAALGADHYADSEHPRLEYDGAGLPSVVSYLQGLRDGTIEQIEADLARIVPAARRIRALPTKVTRTAQVQVVVDGQESSVEQRREYTGAKLEIEFDGAGWIPASQLSEGTLLALGLIVTLRSRPPRMVLLDDIDKALHPVAQRDLVNTLRAILDGLPDVQVLATSHSPFVLDALSAEETFVAGAIDPTRSRITRLDRHPAWEQRKAYMHPGEFWSAVGEGWVGEPSP